jgi:hypothetical protein
MNLDKIAVGDTVVMSEAPARYWQGDAFPKGKVVEIYRGPGSEDGLDASYFEVKMSDGVFVYFKYESWNTTGTCKIDSILGPKEQLLAKLTELCEKYETSRNEIVRMMVTFENEEEIVYEYSGAGFNSRRGGVMFLPFEE